MRFLAKPEPSRKRGLLPAAPRFQSAPPAPLPADVAQTQTGARDRRGERSWSGARSDRREGQAPCPWNALRQRALSRARCHIQITKFKQVFGI